MQKVPVMEVTQIMHPNRATVRTVVAAVIGLLPILPVITDTLGVSTIPWVAGTLAVSAAVTRILANPAVEDYLEEHLPWLAAATKPERKNELENHHDQ